MPAVAASAMASIEPGVEFVALFALGNALKLPAGATGAAPVDVAGTGPAATGATGGAPPCGSALRLAAAGTAPPAVAGVPPVAAGVPPTVAPGVTPPAPDAAGSAPRLPAGTVGVAWAAPPAVAGATVVVEFVAAPGVFSSEPTGMALRGIRHHHHLLWSPDMQNAGSPYFKDSSHSVSKTANEGLRGNGVPYQTGPDASRNYVGT